ncbi:ChuX/HutX family heme-like substrate-binding protein [methane-oxidizing endosymbiont of Gigantopelta aegis]|uniref:ChuX/HutX family heme-like substrate-binding protein n=1 Tax=methane-oxidizing endosymbiont of Gigantopelta aegis TaxID=2794938 RepID=UPI003159A58C
MLRYRDPATPVAIVKSAYRKRQSIQMVRLDEMSDCEIGMLTTVLIGNSSTFVQQGLMITPRGYANKYQSLTGEARSGEQAGRSLSMGLEGWQACLRQYLAEHDVTLEKAAEYFSVPVGAVLEAIAAGEDAGLWHARQVIKSKQDTLWQEMQSWGRLRAIVRAEAGAVTELFLQAKDFKQRGDWLNIENDAFHLHINHQKIDRVWLGWREGKSYGVHFVDDKGSLVFRLLLMKQDGEFTEQTLNAYRHTWQEMEA